MNDAQFQDWMKRIAALDDGGHPPSAQAIWWRAQLRQNLEARRRATRPIRIAEAAGAIVCWLLAAAISAGMGTGGLVVFLAISVAIVGGLEAIAPRRI
jgi:hypothetical protein